MLCNTRFVLHDSCATAGAEGSYCSLTTGCATLAFDLRRSTRGYIPRPLRGQEVAKFQQQMA